MANPAPLTEHLTPFTPETGRAAGEIGNAVISELLQNGKRFKEIEEQDPTRDVEAKAEATRQIKLTNEQLAHTRAELNAKPTVFCEHCKQGGAMPGNHRAALLRELRGLMEHLCRLRGIPDVGHSKPSAPRRQTHDYRPTPTIPAALPEQAKEAPGSS